MNEGINDRTLTASGPQPLHGDGRRAAVSAARRARRHERGSRAAAPETFDLNFARYTAAERHDRLLAAARRQRVRRLRRG